MYQLTFQLKSCEVHDIVFESNLRGRLDLKIFVCSKGYRKDATNGRSSPKVDAIPVTRDEWQTDCAWQIHVR